MKQIERKKVTVIKCGLLERVESQMASLER
jgi:hypothetical protein